MAITVNWATGVISVPIVDLTLVQSSPTVIYDHLMDAFWRDLRALEDSQPGRPFPVMVDYDRSKDVGGVELAPVLILTDYYTVTYEDGQYAVNLKGLNTNVGDRVNVNQVSIRSSNSAGLATSAAIEYGEYGGGVTVDVLSTSVGTAYPTGTQRQPVDNIPEAELIAESRGFRAMFINGDLTLDTGDDVQGYHLIGTSHINSVLTVNEAALCLKTRFSAFDMTGTLDGESEIKDCIVRTLIYFNGHIHDSYLIGTISLSGSLQANISNCKILDVLNPPTINAGGSGQNLMMPNYSGRVIMDNLTGASQIAIGLDAGEVIINSTCTSGLIAVSGNGRVIDNSGAGCYVIDTTVDGSDVNNIQYLIEALYPHHKGFGKVIFWNPYDGNDIRDGGHPTRATSTFAQAHNLADDNGHDVIFLIPGDPSGVTTVTEQIVISKNYVFLRGTGRDCVVHASNDNLSAIQVTGNGVEVSGMVVTTNSTNTVSAIESSGEFPLIKNIYIENSANGILITDGAHGRIELVRIGHNSGYAIKVSGGSDHFVLTSSHLGTNLLGGLIVALTAGHEVTIGDTVIHGSGTYGIDIEAGSNHVQILGDVTLFGNTLGNIRDLGSFTEDDSNLSANVKNLPSAADIATAVLDEVA